MPQPALLAHDLVRVLDGRRVLDGLSLTAAPGQRIGLIGENGVGKSTLLRTLAGVDQPDGGRVQRPADLGFLQQETPFDSTSTVGVVLAEALREAREDLAELDRLATEIACTAEDHPARPQLLDAYAHRLERAQARESWDADRQATLVLDGLGVGRVAHARTLGSLSGGQRGRLLLAALLIRRPSALLLDEPTNHLDDDAAAFVEDQMLRMPGVVVMASHDRAFMDAVCTELVDLDPAVDGPVRYGGNYRAYQAAKRAAREQWERRWSEEQQEMDALGRAAGVVAHRVAPDRGRADNEKMGYGHRSGRVQQQISRRVRNATRRLEDLERSRVPRPPRPLRFAPDALVAPPPRTDPGTPEDGDSGPLVSLRDVRVPGRLAVDALQIAPTDRVLVTGANGAGKSTLLAVLAGQLPTEGEVRRRPGTAVGLLTQDTVFDRPDLAVRDTYCQALGPERAEAVPLTSLGLLHEADLDRPVAYLSVGQRRRLALALLVARPPHLLLLDEPTNHLSPSLCDELEEALGTGPGAVVVASHDRWLRQRWPSRAIRLAGVDPAAVDGAHFRHM